MSEGVPPASNAAVKSYFIGAGLSGLKRSNPTNLKLKASPLSVQGSPRTTRPAPTYSSRVCFGAPNPSSTLCGILSMDDNLERATTATGISFHVDPYCRPQYERVSLRTHYFTTTLTNAILSIGRSYGRLVTEKDR